MIGISRESEYGEGTGKIKPVPSFIYITGKTLTSMKIDVKYE